MRVVRIDHLVGSPIARLWGASFVDPTPLSDLDKFEVCGDDTSTGTLAGGDVVDNGAPVARRETTLSPLDTNGAARCRRSGELRIGTTFGANDVVCKSSIGIKRVASDVGRIPGRCIVGVWDARGTDVRIPSSVLRCRIVDPDRLEKAVAQSQRREGR